jgi:hypothetical protein
VLSQNQLLTASSQMEKSEQEMDSKENFLSGSVRPKNPIDIYRRKEFNLHQKY